MISFNANEFVNEEILAGNADACYLDAVQDYS